MFPSPDLVSIELARLFETSTAWERRFRHYDRMIDAGIEPEEAAQIVTDLAREAETRHELERNAA